jgi:hypothetical protein
MASFLRTDDGLREMHRLLQDFVVRPDFHLPAAATARQLRAVREWLLPDASQCPELHAHLPEGNGLPGFRIDCGHNSAHILTYEERRALREQVPYHLHAPEPSELKQQDKATLPANVVAADNASREQQVKLRPRINANVYAFDSPSIAVHPHPASSGDDLDRTGLGSGMVSGSPGAGDRHANDVAGLRCVAADVIGASDAMAVQGTAVDNECLATLWHFLVEMQGLDPTAADIIVRRNWAPGSQSGLNCV